MSAIFWSCKHVVSVAITTWLPSLSGMEYGVQNDSLLMQVYIATDLTCIVYHVACCVSIIVGWDGAFYAVSKCFIREETQKIW